MRKILLLIVAVLFAQKAHADACAKNLMPPFTAAQANELCAGMASGNQSAVGNLNNTQMSIVVSGTPRWTVLSNGSLNQENQGSNIIFNRAGSNVILVPYVPTMAATPVAGTNQIIPGLNVVPTAALNSAAMLRATPIVGEQFDIWNSGPNSVRIKSGGVATMNNTIAGGYVVLPTLGRMRCITTSASNNTCDLVTLPTPAGP